MTTATRTTRTPRPSRSAGTTCSTPSHPERWHRRLCPVTDQLLLCGDLHHHGTKALAQLAEWVAAGVTHIVDVRADYEVGDDRAFVAHHAPGITYHRVATDDDGRERDDTWFDAGTAAIAAALAEPGAKVVVHCHMGVNRGPSMAYAAMLLDGWDNTEALAAIRRARPIAGLIYAADAAGWWRRRNGASQIEVAAAQRQAYRWLEAHRVDVGRIIARIDRYSA